MRRRLSLKISIVPFGSPMPSKPPRPCSHPGCPELVNDGARCPAHRKEEQKRETRERMLDERVREDKRFYDSALWKRVRASILRKEPWCRECRREGRMGLADMVDHVTPIRLGGAKLAPSNLQPLCERHHQVKRGQEAHVA